VSYNLKNFNPTDSPRAIKISNPKHTKLFFVRVVDNERGIKKEELEIDFKGRSIEEMYEYIRTKYNTE